MDLVMEHLIDRRYLRSSTGFYLSLLGMEMHFLFIFHFLNLRRISQILPSVPSVSPPPPLASHYVDVFVLLHKQTRPSPPAVLRSTIVLSPATMQTFSVRAQKRQTCPATRTGTLVGSVARVGISPPQAMSATCVFVSLLTLPNQLY